MTDAHRTWVWRAELAGERIDRALAVESESREDAPKLSRSQLQRLIEAGHVIVNGRPVKASGKLAVGDLVEVRVPDPEPLELVPEDRPLDILHEDAHLIVVNKPPGLTVHPSETQRTGTLVHALLFHIKDLSGIGGVLRPGIVHRIDKDTSGALVVTKTDAAHAELAKSFATHSIERRYWALCYGAHRERARTIESLIGRNPTDRKRMTTALQEGRRAVTRIQVREEYGTPQSAPFASWIEATLETGRTHQVRVHLTDLGHSILGDPLYGTPSERHTKWLALPDAVRKRVRALPGQALHAQVLGFRHPVTGENLRFEAPLPEAFRLLHEELKRYR